VRNNLRCNIARAQRVALFSRVVQGFVASMLFVQICGCGNGLAQVSGQVTLDGQPLRGGIEDTRVTIQFQPASGAGSTAIGLADENGNYVLGTGSKSGIPPGEYLVTCSAQQIVDAKTPKTKNGVRQVTDLKYANAKTSGLKFTVEPGRNQLDIPLESSTKKAPRAGLTGS
jgi:hypothetical protein